MESLEKFKSTMTYRNKVEDSGIEEVIKVLRDGEDEQLAAMAKDLLDYWSKLELSYRIPRVKKLDSLDEDDHQNTTTIADFEAMPRRHFHVDDFTNTASITFKAAPVRPAAFGPPVRLVRPPPPPPPKPVAPVQIADRSKLDAIIAMAQQASVATVVPSPAAEVSSSARSEEEPRKRQKRSHVMTAEDEAKKEKRLTKLVGEVVVKSMSKYKDQMEHDTFKRYAKEVSQTREVVGSS